MSEILLSTNGLKKYFKTPHGYLHAVDGVSLSIEKGKTLGVVGESGCGKSTLGRTVLRLIEPTSGDIFYRGENIAKYGKEQIRQMHQSMQIIFQDPYASLNPRMTVSEIIGDPMKVYKTCKTPAELNSRVAALMRTVGLADRFVNTYPHELDGGRRQRIGIARALSVDPAFIVCDEPVSALDVSIQAQILNLLMDLQEERGLTYIFITHDLSVVKHISDEIMVMYLGCCVERAPSRELFVNPLHPYTKELLNAIPIPSLAPENRLKNIIRGEVTSPIEPPKGCRFAARCKYAGNHCVGHDIPLKETGSGHYVACTLFQDS